MNSSAYQLKYLEQSALILMKCRNFAPTIQSAAGVFSMLASNFPDYVLAWYGLGNSLMGLSALTGDARYMAMAARSLKRCLVEAPDMRYAQELLDKIRTFEPSTNDLSEPLMPLTNNLSDVLKAIDFSGELVAESLRYINDPKERMMLVMLLGDSGEFFVPLLIAAIDNDADRDVKMSALKRIGRYKSIKGVRECLERLISGEKWSELEPYPSMILRTIGEAWSNQLLDQMHGT